MKVLVTGGTGFLGKATIKELLKRGYEPVSLARSRTAAISDLGVPQVEADISRIETIKNCFAGIEAVIHTAAKAGVWGAYDEYYAANVIGTQNVVDCCIASNTKYLVHTSSPSVVFNGSDQEGINEKTAYPQSYLAHYPETKSRAERIVAGVPKKRLKTVTLRPHLIWGPGDNHLVPRIVSLAQAGKLRLIGSGEKLVDAVYIENAAAAEVDALEALVNHADDVNGRVFFITNDEPQTMRQILEKITEAAGINRPLRSVSPMLAFQIAKVLEWFHLRFRPETEPRLTRFSVKQLSTAHWYDTNAARRVLGYRPKVSMAEGYLRLADSLQERG